MSDVWLVNPPKKGRKRMAARKKATTRKPPKGFRSWKTYMAYVRSGGKKKSTRSTGGRTVAARKTTRKRATTTRRRAPVRRRKRRTTRTKSIRFTPIKGRAYRRNPPLNKALKTLTEGVQNAAFAVVGKAAARSVSAMIPFGASPAADVAKQAVVAVGLGMVADKFLPKRRAEFIVAGALMGPIESMLQAANIPIISGALSSYPRGLSAYPRRALAGGRQPTGLGMIPARIHTSPSSMGAYDHAAML